MVEDGQSLLIMVETFIAVFLRLFQLPLLTSVRSRQTWTACACYPSFSVVTKTIALLLLSVLLLLLLLLLSQSLPLVLRVC